MRKPRRGGGRFKLPVPGDFAENAKLRNDELARMYDVSYSVVQKWRRETGLRGTRGRGPTKGRLDTQRQIDACLTCKLDDCPGDCPARRAKG